MPDTLVFVKQSGRDILAVKQQVDREALEAWGKRQYKPFTTIPPMKGEKMSVPALHVLKSQLWQLVP